MRIHRRRKRFLIAKALWDFITENRKKPIKRQTPNDVHDMEAILNSEYQAELETLLALERFQNR